MKGHAYATWHSKSRMICEAFAKGSGWPVVPPAPLRAGAVFLYGILRGTHQTLLQAQADGRVWYYADNGYFRRGRDHGYFRITKNAMQHDGAGDASPDRWNRLRLTINPWRKNGSHVLVCPPDEVWGRAWGFDPNKWTRDTLKTLQNATDRQVVVRDRSKAGSAAEPFEAALRGAWALVTHSSNAATEALLAGIPVFVTDACAAYRMGKPDVAEIEAPAMPDDRERWARALAANQWNLEEMRSGLCWRELSAQ